MFLLSHRSIAQRLMDQRVREVVQNHIEQTIIRAVIRRGIFNR